jgi:hypothetical protein
MNPVLGELRSPRRRKRLRHLLPTGLVRWVGQAFSLPGERSSPAKAGREACVTAGGKLDAAA